MSRPLRLILLAAIGLAGVIVLIAAVLYSLLKANVNKARLEATASAALGMEFSIDGPLGTALFPGLLVTIEGVHIRNRGADVASAQQASIDIELLPLLENDVRISKIVLKQPTITIERGRDGQFNFEKPEAVESALPLLDWPLVSVSDATLVYSDKRFGERFEAQDCQVDVHGLRLSGGPRSSFMKDLAFTAELACGKVLGDGFTVSELKLSADAKSGVFELTPLTARVFGAQGSGNIQADFSKAVPVYHVRYSLPQFPVEEFFKVMSRQKVAAGRMDFSANLSMQGTTGKQILRILGEPDWESAFRKLEAFRLESVAGQIECDLFIVHGENDRHAPPSEAQRLLAAVSSKHKQLRIFTQAEGGSAHVNLDRPEPALSLLCDWMSDRLHRT